MSVFSLFLLTFLRMAGLLMVAPMFAGKFVPVRFRVLLALAMTLVVGSAQMVPGMVWESNWLNARFCVAAGTEVFIGVAMGTAVLLFFSALQVAGSVMAYVGGLSFPVDAGLSNEASSIFSKFLLLLGIAVVFLTNGHHAVIESLLRSFQHFPVGAMVNDPHFLRSVFEVFFFGFALGVRIALPVVAVLLLVQVGLAILNRIVPQLNVFALGFAVNALLVLAILSLSLGVGMYVFEEQFAQFVPLPQ